MQVNIAWIDGDGTTLPALPPFPPKFSDPPPAPAGPPAAGSNGSSGGSQAGGGGPSGGSGGAGAGGDGPPAPPHGGPKVPPPSPDQGPPPQGVPPLKAVLLDLLPPDDDPGDSLPTFVEAAVLPPENNAVILAVPEPGLLALLGVAALGLLATSRKRPRQG
ncbi:PEP-CTERM sorting domain-containing protein [Chitinimonas sp.]|uniref:PEP-CTERM sorting domain-containing protein n=1 Tax=Chitinimonas sp. TaxID=1934313 RepID=UPI002F93BF33